MVLHCIVISYILSFFFNDTATTEIYTLSLHDALPIFLPRPPDQPDDLIVRQPHGRPGTGFVVHALEHDRSEEHTSELQSRENLVCRLLLEKKKTYRRPILSRRTCRKACLHHHRSMPSP